MEENYTRSSKSKPAPKKSKKLLIVFLALLLILGGTAGFGYLQYQKLFIKPLDATATELVPMKITYQETIRDVADRLQEAGVIETTWPIRFIAKQRNIEYVETEGNYAFAKSMTIDEILTILENGETAYDWQIVVGDGVTFDKLLSDFAWEDAEIPYLDAQINDVDYIRSLMEKYPFLPEEILGDGFRHRLEGFLGNGTYYLKYEATIQEFVELALDQFQANYIEHNWEQRLQAVDKTLFEVVTMASVVRGEVMSGDTENQKIVAGVFYNRVDAGDVLGSDVTVGYAINAPDINYTQEQLNTDSPYNTYVYPGLPLGPISNPGADVIDAVIDYTPNSYYYFLADICDDNYGEFGQIYYSETYAEHDSYSREYLGCYRTFD